MVELKVLQAVRLKGKVNPAGLAATVDEDPATVASTVAGLIEAGLLIGGKALKLSPDGRSRLRALLEQERAGVDHCAIAAAYEEFVAANADFKVVVSDWKLKDGESNHHDDPDHDAAVLARLEAVHARVLKVISAAAEQIPRLRGYADKLVTALQMVQDGDTVWLTQPVVDSYHTVWFELHEELILAAEVTPGSSP